MLRLSIGVGLCLTLLPAYAEEFDTDVDKDTDLLVDLDADRDILADLWDWDDEEDTSREGQVAQASSIPNRPTATVVLRKGTYDFGGRTIDGSGVGSGAPLFRCNKQSGVTLKNVKIVGNPRYGVFVRSCDGISISGVTLKKVAVGGIRFDAGYPSKNVKIGTITASDIGGHAVELWDAKTYSVSKVTAKKTKGCGLLVNRCQDGTVGTVDGSENNKGGGYATMRFANRNGKVRVSKVKSRSSGRGVFSVSNSKDATVSNVDISGATSDGIYIQDSKNTRVNGGKSRGSPNCRIRGGSGNSLNCDCGGSISG